MKSSDSLKRFLLGFFLSAVALVVGWIWYETNAEDLPALDHGAALKQFYQRHGGPTPDVVRIFSAMLAGKPWIRTGTCCWRRYAPDIHTLKYHQQVLMAELGGMGAVAAPAAPSMSRLLAAPEWEIRLAAATALLQVVPTDGAAAKALAQLIVNPEAGVRQLALVQSMALRDRTALLAELQQLGTGDDQAVAAAATHASGQLQRTPRRPLTGRHPNPTPRPTGPERTATTPQVRPESPLAETLPTPRH